MYGEVLLGKRKGRGCGVTFLYTRPVDRSLGADAATSASKELGSVVLGHDFLWYLHREELIRIYRLSWLRRPQHSCCIPISKPMFTAEVFFIKDA